MISWRRFLSPVAAGLAVVFFLPACGNPEEVSGRPPEALLNVPSQVLGLQVELEDVTDQVKDVDRPFLDALAVFSLREGDLLRATLQVGRFNSLGRPGSASFRQRILQKIGSQAPEPYRIGDKTTYVTAGNKQSIFVWFSGRGMFVLIAHKDYLFPRTLARRFLEMDLDL
jgi:hypothetical protein